MRKKEIPKAKGEFILLSDWAKREGIDLMKAKDMARRGRLRPFVKIKDHPTPRFFIREDAE